MLCNQLFENWCKEEYSLNIASFRIVNGSGGDGGVESYATSINGDIIGLQAKWFPLPEGVSLDDDSWSFKQFGVFEWEHTE